MSGTPPAVGPPQANEGEAREAGPQGSYAALPPLILSLPDSSGHDVTPAFGMPSSVPVSWLRLVLLSEFQILSYLFQGLPVQSLLKGMISKCLGVSKTEWDQTETFLPTVSGNPWKRIGNLPREAAVLMQGSPGPTLWDALLWPAVWAGKRVIGYVRGWAGRQLGGLASPIQPHQREKGPESVVMKRRAEPPNRPDSLQGQGAASPKLLKDSGVYRPVN